MKDLFVACSYPRLQYAKSVLTLSYSGPYFLHSDSILRISPYSVWMRENADQNNSEYGHFLRSVNQSLMEDFTFWAMTPLPNIIIVRCYL